MTSKRASSILAADFGNVNTRLVLIDVVEGFYRLVAQAEGHSTAEFPFHDVSIGMNRIIDQLSTITGRRLVNDAHRIISPEQADRSGVDYFLSTASIGRPLRTVLVGLVPELSIASGLRAAAGTYIEISAIISLDDGRDEEGRLNALMQAAPDLVLITGGTEGGAQEPVLELARVVELALNLLELPLRPTVVYAGNSQLAPQISQIFQRLTKLLIADNVRPTLDDEYLDDTQLQLGMAFDKYTETRGQGFDEISEMSALGILPTAQSYNLIVEYLGKALDAPVMAFDIGSAVSTMSASVEGRIDTSIRTDLGLGHSAYNLLEAVSIERVQAWLPFYASAEEIETYARNKTLRPATIPQTLRDLYIEYALLRGGIKLLLDATRPNWYDGANVALNQPLPPFSPIIGAGATLTRTGNPGLTAMLMLDALQPEGLTPLRTDPHGLIASLGALSYVKPEAVVQVLDGNNLQNLGTSISLSGEPRLDRPALQIKIQIEDGDLIEHTLNGGHLWVFPLQIGQVADIDVRAKARGTRIAGRGRLQARVEGGIVGLIFDARGRNLPLSRDLNERAAQMALWMAEATNSPVQDIDPDWLIIPKKSAPVADIAKRTGGLFSRGKAEKPSKADQAKATSAAVEDPDMDDFQDDLKDLRDVLS
jgi:hypothetical protein